MWLSFYNAQVGWDVLALTKGDISRDDLSTESKGTGELSGLYRYDQT